MIRVSRLAATASFFLLLFSPLAFMNFNRSASTVAIAVLLAGLASMPAVARDGEAGAIAGASQRVSIVEVPSDIQKALGLKVSAVREQVLGTGVAANGRIEALPDRIAQINAPVVGRVLRLAVQSGQAVKTGQTLVVLDSPEIRQLAVEQERARAESGAQVNAARSRVNLAKSTYGREKELVALKISARKDFQVAEAELRQAEAELAVVRSRLQLSGSALRSRLAGLGQGRAQAQADGSVVLTSPLSGVVTAQQVTAGEAVEPGKTLFEVVNTTRVWATAQVYEKDLGRVRTGQSIEKEGVRAGDRVVSERAFQLRAQGLKSQGASFGGDEHGENTDQTQANEKQTGQTQADQDRLPGWLWALGAQVLAALAFLSGLQVASRRGTPLAAPLVSPDSPYNS